MQSMYKTIRHGESSLQYTILPQNDHDGHNKISTSGRNSKNRRRKSIFKYLGLLFVCSIIIGAVLIPFLVSTDSLPGWILKSKEAFRGGRNNSKYGKSNNTLNNSRLLAAAPTKSPLLDSTPSNTQQNQVNLLTSTKNSSIPSFESKTTKKYENSNELNSISNSRNKITDVGYEATDNFQSYDLNKNYNNKINENIISEIKIDHLMPSILYVTTAKFEQEIPITAIPITTVNTPSTFETIKNLTPKLSAPKLNPTISKYGHSKRPTTSPVSGQKTIIKKNPITAAKNFTTKNNVTESKWISAHWPYVDPSLYLKLTGYKSEKSILLPAVLGAVLIIIVILVSICLIKRNKRQILTNIRKRNKTNIDESSEDNTTLLNASHGSDEE